MKKTNMMYFAFSLVLILLLSLFTACELPPGTEYFAERGGPVDTDDTTPTSALVDSDSTTPIKTDWSIPSAEGELQVLPTIADVVAAVKPSVVAIDTEVTYSFFRRSFTQEGIGSGWIIDEDGIIVTNSHVVAGAESIIVTLDDSRTFTVDPNTVVTDQLNDLAILKIDAENLPAANIGDSSALRVGDWVVTIGNPLGLGISAKEGIVSRLDVSLTVEGQTLDHFIETSAAINPGNSGGPLVNMKGEVVGITSAKISSVGVEGLGYAIGINDAIPDIDELIARPMALP